jgi:cation transport protein ChaC
VFGYASLIWRPEFDHIEHRLATVHGWHRALKMWSRINRGTRRNARALCLRCFQEAVAKAWCSAFPRPDGRATLERLWAREMVTAVYDPRWLHCHTAKGAVKALAFTLSRKSPNHTGELTEAQYRQIFAQACGRYGTTLDYAQRTLEHCASTTSTTRRWSGFWLWPKTKCPPAGGLTGDARPGQI